MEHGLLEIGDADLCDVQKIGPNVAKATNGKQLKSKAKDLPGRAAHRNFGLTSINMGWDGRGWDGTVGMMFIEDLTPLRSFNSSPLTIYHLKKGE